MGGGRASGVYTDTGASSFEYVIEADKALAELQSADVLVIGSAGFTFPRDAAALPFVQRIDAVDVDPVVQKIAEQQFLRQPLPPKVRFLPLSARYAVRRLHQDHRNYGFTFVDAYFGQSIPQELVTLEFFEDLRKVSEHTAFNVIMDRSLESTFAQNLLATVREAFGGVWVTEVTPGLSYTSNLQVTTWPRPSSTEWNGTGRVYRDDKNSADRDYIALVWASD
jgi:spermidine synthase